MRATPIAPARLRSVLLSLLAALTLSPRDAVAQRAPTGDHYAARPSDTGFETGSTSPLGRYTTSIPLALPTVRKGLPVPLQIAYTGHGFGAAGLGWDMPLSYVLVDGSLAHRRPTNSQNVAPKAYPLVSLSLAGQTIDLVPHGTTWIGRSGGATMTLQASGASYVLYDGDGRTWTFTRDTAIANAGAGLWLLHSISGAGASQVTLNYSPATTVNVGEVNKCPNGTPGNTRFYPSQIAGMRDVTGDGIPDYITAGGQGWNVWVGTGSDFVGPITVSGVFGLSGETEECDGKMSMTTWGLYDLDGDGKPDVVNLDGSNLDVYQLSGGASPREPEAGLLTLVDNGYGALTGITYRSAKEDGTTYHQVPFPEIVVSQTQTVGTLGLGGTLAATLYAYGGAQMYYDSSHESFRLPAYRRVVALRPAPTAADAKASAIVNVTDTYPLASNRTAFQPE